MVLEVQLRLVGMARDADVDSPEAQAGGRVARQKLEKLEKLLSATVRHMAATQP